MPPVRPPNLSIRPRVHLDLVTSKLIVSCHSTCIDSKFIRFQNKVIVFTSLVTEERPDGRTDKLTDRKHNASACQARLAEA